MGFTKEKREQIKRYVLDKINNGEKNIAQSTAAAFGISLNTVYRYLRELEAEAIIQKNGGSFRLIEKIERFTLKRTDGDLGEEDVIYSQYINRHIEGLPDNVVRIWQYSFMEMMNNAIEHSMAESVKVFVLQSCLSTTIIIQDDGIGIFKKIKDFYQYASLDDAVNELFKGKLTTDRKNHSGEGIFFTSRALDRFAAVSDGKVFAHDKYYELLQNLEDTGLLKERTGQNGTVIYMELSNDSKKNLKEVFDMFSDVDGGFTKTRIPIKNIYETYPVSRSQAKRLCHRFDKFQEIVLDFDGIDEIGQAFAHEIFVVFQNNHKDITLVPENTNEDVKKMICHVKQTIL